MSRSRHLLALCGAAALIVGALSLGSSPVDAVGSSEAFETPGTYDFVVPAGVSSVTADVYGAAGGSGGSMPPVAGGLGGRTTATIAVTAGETLRVVVGGVGGSSTGSSTAIGGSNGGGDAGSSGAGAGGGASDVRQGGVGLGDRVVVAGGGGGAGGRHCQEGTGGDGGGTTPTAGGSTGYANGGEPGGANAGGAGGTDMGGGLDMPGEPGGAGFGGAGAVGLIADGAGGGGAGWYGGGGGASGTVSAGGGGGSAHVVGTATDVSFQDGVRAGDGKVVLSWIAPAPTTTTSTAAPTTTTTVAPTTTTPAGPSAAYGSTPGRGETARTVSAGGSLTVNSSGWYPGSTVTATMYSTPVRLGEIQVDSTGAFVTELAVPAWAVNGSHRLELSGTGANGAPAVVNLAITVTGGAGGVGSAAPSSLAFVC